MYETKLYFDGEKPHIQAKDKLVEFLSKFGKDTWFEIVVKPIGTTSSQSRLYFKWCDIMASELGWDSGQELHEYFKDTFNNGESTKSLDVKQWSQYMTKILAFAAEHNFTLPTGNVE